jgi:hypothetical protein
MPKKTLALFALIHLSALALLSYFSSYQIPGFNDADWTTVLFLTPLGIVINFVQGRSALLSFYGDPSQGNVHPSALGWLMMSICYLTLLGIFYFYRRLEKK